MADFDAVYLNSTTSALALRVLPHVPPVVFSHIHELDSAFTYWFPEHDRRAMLEATDLFIAIDDGGTIIGTATLVTFRIPTGMRAWIEDVVVDEAGRGQGVGMALTDAMVERARELGCRTVDLTSRPSREAANRMYQRAGFVARDTNVYRLADDD